MSDIRKPILAATLVAFALMVAAPASAPAEKGPYWETSRAAHMSMKLVRGFENIFFSFVEIPSHIILEWQKTDPFTGLWLGFGKGLFHMGKRLGYGFYDVFTFPFRLKWDDRINPEVVLLDRID